MSGQKLHWPRPGYRHRPRGRLGCRVLGCRVGSMGLGATKGAGGCTYGNRRVLLPFRVLFRVVSELSVQNTPREPRRCGGFRAVNRTLTRLWNKKIFGRQRPQTPYRACVRGRRHQIFQKSSVWRPARPERSGNVTINHIPRKQNDSGGLWCQNSSLKFWPPGTELWPARVQKKQNKCI